MNDRPPRDEKDPTGETVSFGFRAVRASEKPGLVRGVFDRVADRYDLMNDLMSGGAHRIWKSVLIDRLSPQPGRTLLDMAGGTGDVAEAYIARADGRPSAREVAHEAAHEPTPARAAARAPARAIVCDVNVEMLRAGLERAARENRPGLARAARLAGDAENIPLADASVDAYAISFGIRNVTRIEKALREARRVLRYGGVFACLEFSHPVTEGLQRAYDAYSFGVIPWLGETVAGDRESYEYLVESIRRFPGQDAFAGMIETAGFARVSYENLTGGVAALHLGWRI